MALEPITRQEKIISGENLEPITRMERFLKEFGGGGSGGGVSPEEVTTIVKEQFPGGVGYEEVQTVNEPLNITWDGNTEGLVNVGDMYFKVSDAVLTIEQYIQIRNGEIHASISIGGGEMMDLGTFGLSPNENRDAFSAEIVIFALKSNANLGNFVFPEPGIYFAKVDENTFASAMTTDFPLEQTKVVTKKLDKKYLPNTGGGVFVVEVDWDNDKVITPLNDIRDAWLNHTPIVLYRLDDTDAEAYHFAKGSVRGDNGNFWSATFIRMDEGDIRFYYIHEDGTVEYNSLDIEMTEGR